MSLPHCPTSQMTQGPHRLLEECCLWCPSLTPVPHAQWTVLTCNFLVVTLTWYLHGAAQSVLVHSCRRASWLTPCCGKHILWSASQFCVVQVVQVCGRDCGSIAVALTVMEFPQHALY